MNIALLTGRGKSVSLPNKNILKVLGRPMMTYPLLMAKQAKTIQDTYISTDGEELLKIADSMGIKKIIRPDEISKPDSQHKDAILHALDWLEEREIYPEIIVVLLCNVGTHLPGTIDKCVQVLMDNPEIDSAVTIDERNEYHPLRAKKINNKGFLEPFLEIKEGKKISTNRQDLDPCYFLDHTLWALRVESCLKSNKKGQPPWDFMGKNIVGVPCKGAIDIHTIADIAYTERWLLESGWDENNIPNLK